MCDCIKKAETSSLKLDIKNKTIERAQFISGVIMFSTGRIHSCSEMELTIKGQNKKGIHKILHIYCPFCGKKYPKVK